MFARSRFRVPTVAIALALAIGCSSDTASPNAPGSERPPEALNVSRLATTAPPLEESTVSFWAVKGQGVEQKLYFLDSQGQRGEEYLALKLENESLSLRPDGSAIAEGDSVLITITVEDPALLLFELQPTGLKFSTEPAGGAQDPLRAGGRRPERGRRGGRRGQPAGDDPRHLAAGAARAALRAAGQREGRG